MIPKSGYRFSEKIMLKQQAKAKQRTNLKSFRFSAPPRESTPRQRDGAKYLFIVRLPFIPCSARSTAVALVSHE
jgi:DNA-binding winged helix-turn-helix (wHTH) protein